MPFKNSNFSYTFQDLLSSNPVPHELRDREGADTNDPMNSIPSEKRPSIDESKLIELCRAISLGEVVNLLVFSQDPFIRGWIGKALATAAANAGLTVGWFDGYSVAPESYNINSLWSCSNLNNGFMGALETPQTTRLLNADLVVINDLPTNLVDEQACLFSEIVLARVEKGLSTIVLVRSLETWPTFNYAGRLLLSRQHNPRSYFLALGLGVALTPEQSRAFASTAMCPTDFDCITRYRLYPLKSACRLLLRNNDTQSDLYSMIDGAGWSPSRGAATGWEVIAVAESLYSRH